MVRSAACGLPPANSPSGNCLIDTNATMVSIHFIVSDASNLEPFLHGIDFANGKITPF